MANFNPKFLTDENVLEALKAGDNCVAAISVSGGKDSSVLGCETNAYLDSIGFTGERILVHSDLGLIEHTQSIEICKKLSAHLGIPLVVVKPKRPMIERWEYRWECVLRRFVNLETVRLSTWASSARNRFCTSESKTTPICRSLKNSYQGKTILNVIGLRRQESIGRAAKPVSQKLSLLTVKAKNTFGLTWMPILDYSLEDVFLTHKKHDFPLHEAYTKFGLSRVSCSYCVLAGENDLRASLTDERNIPAFRQIARLEIASSFSFKDGFWLYDLAPHLLTENERQGLKAAKDRAIARRFAERIIPDELLFDKDTGFPAFQPTMEQAGRLAQARSQIGAALGVSVKFITARNVYDRYAELLEIKRLKEAKNPKITPEKVQLSLFG